MRQLDTGPDPESGNFGRGQEKTRGTILVVDDEWLVRWALSESLGSAGYAVRVAQDASTALEAFRQPGRVDAVLLDLRLPDCKDMSLLERLKQIAPGCPMILITAHGSHDLAEQARHAGAYGVVDKPFDIEAVIALVAEALDATRHGDRTSS
jgi:DNA-binding NtrC family response regulator